jgi:hypothetical protein
VLGSFDDFVGTLNAGFKINISLNRDIFLGSLVHVPFFVPAIF